MHLLDELRAFLTGAQARARADRQIGPLLDLEIGGDIAAEAGDFTTALRQRAHTARCADDEAARHLELVLADGRVDPEEIPLLHTALKHIRRSAQHDHHLAESL
jgi:hypothetical protein